ncbi:MAG: hypothetical protein ACKVH8_13375 [Pirellulales bacterium]
MFAKQALLFALLITLLIGCNQDNTAPISDANEGPSANIASQDMPTIQPLTETIASVSQDPKSTVKVFLNALKNGDKLTTAQLLTTKAKEENARHGQSVNPPGLKTAQFEVGEVVYMTSEKSGAHVPSFCIDTNQAGELQKFEIVWILRKQSQGWRIAGMATELFAGEPPLLLNFEDPQELIRQQHIAEQELARRANPAATGNIQQAGHTESTNIRATQRINSSAPTRLGQ